MAEGVGFEPTVALRLLLISSQVPLTTQPPFHAVVCEHTVAVEMALAKSKAHCFIYPARLPVHRRRRVHVRQWVD